MNLTNRFCITLLVFLLSANAAGQTCPVTKLMEISGINQQIEQMPEHINASLTQTDGLPEETRKQLSQAMTESFATDKLKKTIHDYLLANLSETDLNTTLAWLESPLGQKITRLEIENSDTEATQAMQQKLPELLNDTKRFSLMRDLDEATNASQATIAMVLNIQKAMLLGMMAAAPDDERMNEADIDQLIASIRPQIESQYELLVIASMAYSYRSLSDAEIHQYIDFARSNAGQRYHQQVIKAMSKAMNEASHAAGSRLGDILDN